MQQGRAGLAAPGQLPLAERDYQAGRRQEITGMTSSGFQKKRKWHLSPPAPSSSSFVFGCIEWCFLQKMSITSDLPEANLV
jgi:hypothetical protein